MFVKVLEDSLSFTGRDGINLKDEDAGRMSFVETDRRFDCDRSTLKSSALLP
jgi:hypothetical protein